MPTASSRRLTSFRDPGGRVVIQDGRVLRFVNEAALDDVRAFLFSERGQALQQSQIVIGTRQLPQLEAGEALARFGPDDWSETGVEVFEHEPVPFPSFPAEWSPEMLYAAGMLTLTLAEECLDAGVGLKDATPYNVLFRDTRPVFVDLLSFERRDAHDPTWLPYAQFMRNFVLPLEAYRSLGITPAQTFSTRRDGLEPDDLYTWLHPLRRVSPRFLGLVTIPHWLSRFERKELYESRKVADTERASFMLRWAIRGLRKKMKRLTPASAKSVWSGYMSQRPSYSEEQFRAKAEFIERVFADEPPRRVLDAGCNTGHFSKMAARNGASVVSIDYDPAVVGRLYSEAAAEKMDILPLVVDLSRPTPAQGWRNQEVPAFLDRARGFFDTVLMLAFIHHLIVSERVPLDEIMDLAAELTTDRLIIEYVGREDPMFQKLLRGRDHLHRDFTQEFFETTCLRRFDIAAAVPLPGAARRLYVLRKRAA